MFIYKLCTKNSEETTAKLKISNFAHKSHISSKQEVPKMLLKIKQHKQQYQNKYL